MGVRARTGGARVSGRRRRQERPARQRILMMRLADAEHAALSQAAERSGLTLSGYAATAALAAAAGQPAPDDRQAQRLMSELMATRAQLRIEIVTWIERTYHRRRRQAALGRLTPIEYETIMPTAADQTA